MKPTIADLKDSFKISADVFRESRNEAMEVIDFYHNRQYTKEEITTLIDRGQPVETFNIVKMLTHATLGYLSTVTNDVQVRPRHFNDSLPAQLISDVHEYVLERNDFDEVSLELKQDLLLWGMSCCYENVVPTGETDQYGRKMYEVELSRIPPWQVHIDPLSRMADYSDARYVHRYQWIAEEELKARWPHAVKKLDDSEYNFLDDDDQAEFTREYGRKFVGKFKYWHNYMIVHSIVKEIVGGKTKYWSVIWSDELILEKKEVSYKDVKMPYRVSRLFKSDKSEYYSMHREVVESQKAINQALIQIQMLVNTSKAFVEDGAVEDIEAFRESFNRVNAVVEVTSLLGIKIEDMSRDIQAQYLILDNALQRVKSVLGINDSFLGQAAASDSGRKVQIQRQSSASQMTVIVNSVNHMLKHIGRDVVGLIQQYYVAEQVLRVSDKINGDKYVEINKPLQIPTGQFDPRTGQPMTQVMYDEELDPETNQPLEDEEGNILITPLNNPETDLRYSQVDVIVEPVPYNNAEERNQLLLETFLQGPVGQFVGQLDAASFMKVAAMQVKEFGAKHSPDIANILEELATKISGGEIDPMLAQTGGNSQAIMGGANGGNVGNQQNASVKSPTLQIPTKFNEGSN